MRVEVYPPSEQNWERFFIQSGGDGYPVYTAYHPYQRGAEVGRLFRGLFRAAMSVLKNVKLWQGRL